MTHEVLPFHLARFGRSRVRRRRLGLGDGPGLPDAERGVRHGVSEREDHDDLRLGGAGASALPAGASMQHEDVLGAEVPLRLLLCQEHRIVFLLRPEVPGPKDRPVGPVSVGDQDVATPGFAPDAVTSRSPQKYAYEAYASPPCAPCVVGDFSFSVGLTAFYIHR